MPHKEFSHIMSTVITRVKSNITVSVRLAILFIVAFFLNTAILLAIAIGVLHSPYVWGPIVPFLGALFPFLLFMGELSFLRRLTQTLEQLRAIELHNLDLQYGPLNVAVSPPPSTPTPVVDPFGWPIPRA